MVDESKLLVPDELIMNKIYLIRGQKVMLDNDLAELYAVETRRLNEQVKRNIERFPEDFMFQLESGEFENLKSQFAISRWGGRSYTRLSQMLLLHKDILLRLDQIEQKLAGHDDNILLIFEYLRQLEQSRQQLDDQANRKKIGFRHDD